MSSLALFINATLINTTGQKKLSSKLKEQLSYNEKMTSRKKVKSRKSCLRKDLTQ